ncbi:MAG: sporulation protein [Oscillibacter sp.]|nr:sporulation protein [Oscillibacter sp.]
MAVTLLPLSALFLWLLLDAGTFQTAAWEALNLCARSVVPALFPFLVVSGLLVSQGFGEWCAPLFSGLMTPLFRLPGTAGGALALGLAGGYPVGARAAADLYSRGLLTREEAERLLSFCNNASPAYFLRILGGVFGSTRTGLWLYLIHLLSALLTGLLFRGYGETVCGPGSGEEYPSAPPNAPPPFLPSLVDAVGNAAQSMLRLCAFVLFFSTLAAPLRNLGGTAAAAAGLLDLFSLTGLLSPDRTGFVLVSALAAFGGLGVLGQTAAALEDSGLSLRPCLLGKAAQGLLAGGIAFMVSGILL